MSDMILQIDVVEGGEVVDSHELSDKKIKVGKLASSQLHLDDPNVSRIHAVLERQGDGSTYQAIDLGSASGTYVNGKKITKATVGDGDEMQFGETTVRLSIVDLEAQRQAEQQAATGLVGGEVPEGHIQLEDGTVVEPFTMEGYYDDDGNYIPGYYDDEGRYHYGYGYHDDQGTWQVAHGFYDPEGEWIPTAPPEGEKPSDTELYTEQFFESQGGRVLEIAYLWSDAVLDVQSFATPRSVFIGGDDNNDYVLEDQVITHPRFPLVVFDEGDGYRVVFTPQMSGTVQRDGQQYSLNDLIEQGIARPSKAIQGAYSVALTRTMSARLDFGRNTFLLHFTSMPAVAAGASMGFHGAPFFYQGVSFGLHVAFMLLVFMLPDGFGNIELHDFQAEDRFAEMDIDPEEEEEEEEELDEDFLEDEPEDSQEAEAPPEETEEEDLEIEGAEDMDEDELQEARDREIAQQEGALAALGDPQQAMGPDSNTLIAAVDSEHVGDGLAGIGPEGPGRIGAGDGEGVGHTAVGGPGGGGGGGGGENVEIDHDTLEPQVIPQEPVTEGALDREIIQRVVRQNRRDIQNCYESELNRNPSLAGRVTMQWVISPGGDVVSASVEETSLNSSAVEGCMRQRIMRWSFPEPDGGGVVRVNYPFNFST